MPNKFTDPRERIILSLDVKDAAEAVELYHDLRGDVGVFLLKRNLLLASPINPAWRGLASIMNHQVFFDLNLVDTPKVMGRVIEELLELYPWAISLYGEAGKQALQAAVEVRDHICAAHGLDDGERTRILVTPRLSHQDWAELAPVNPWLHISTKGEAEDFVEKLVLRRARAALEFADGVVVSPKETAMLRAEFTPERAVIAARVNTLNEVRGALQFGADYVIVEDLVLKPPQGMTRFQAARRVKEEVMKVMMSQ